MLFLAVLFAIFAVVAFEYVVYRKRALADIKYSAYLSAGEVFEGENVYFYEEIRNEKRLPVGYIKVDTELPAGLCFALIERSGDKEEPRVTNTGRIQSVFSMEPYSEIKRRWRVVCQRRGEYELQGAIAVSNDILGLNSVSTRFEQNAGRAGSRIIVLPKAVSLEEHFTSSFSESGEVISEFCPVSDPLMICGSREYNVYDPMNKINWKQSAVHGSLMVNIEEKTVRHRFAILLNMNSREIENIPNIPSDSEAVEFNISVCASVLDRVALEEVSVRIITNTKVEGLEYLTPVGGDLPGSKIYMSELFRGRRDLMEALRLLALIKLEITLPADKMLDHIAANPQIYTDCENLLVISSYLDSRLLNLHTIMRGFGVNVVYYITTSRKNIGVIPEGVEIYYKTY